MAIIIVALLRGLVGGVLGSSMTLVMKTRTYFSESTATLPRYIRDRSTLDAEIRHLEEEVAAQSGDRATIARLVAENNELRSLMGSKTEERILSGVIARPPSVPYDLLVIDRGEEHGVQEGALVYHLNDHAIGLVSRVYRTSALVTLFTSAGTEFTVYLYGPDVYAYAYGEGGGVVRISLPQGIDVKEGDPVVLPSIHQGDVGVVDRVVSISTQPEQNAYLALPVSIQSIRSVRVGREVVPTPSPEDLTVHIDAIKNQFLISIPEALRTGVASSTGGVADPIEPGVGSTTP